MNRQRRPLVLTRRGQALADGLLVLVVMAGLYACIIMAAAAS